MPLVSIIVPIYDVELYISRCIKSLINQTENDIEIILIDDGSPDKSGMICDSYAKSDGRIKVIHTSNQGVSCARNMGITIAKGEWICFVDGDDYACNNMVEVLLSFLSENKYDIICADYYLCNKDEDLKIEYFFEKEQVFQKEKLAELVKSMLVFNERSITNIGVPWGKLYSKAFLERNNIFFLPGLKRMQDTIFNMKAFILAENVKYAHTPIYNYVMRENSAVHKYSPDYGDTINVLVNELEKYKDRYQDLLNWDELITAKKIMLFREWCSLYLCHDSCNLGLMQKRRKIERKYKELFKEQIKDNGLVNKKQFIMMKLCEKNLYLFVYFWICFKQSFRKF